MLRLVHRLSVVAALVVLTGLPALAQAQAGRITGVVRDAQGAPREAVRVTATNAATGVTRGTTTGTGGADAIPDLAPGTYTVAAQLLGYRRVERTGVQVSGETTVDLSLEALALQEVVVTATLR